MFRTANANTFANSNTTIQPVDPSDKVVADNNEQVKGILMRLYNDNDWVIEEQIPIVPKKKGKLFTCSISAFLLTFL